MAFIVSAVTALLR